MSTKQKRAAQRGRNIMDAYLIERGYKAPDEADLRDLLVDLMVMAAVDTDNYEPFAQQAAIALRNFQHEFSKLAKSEVKRSCPECKEAWDETVTGECTSCGYCPPTCIKTGQHRDTGRGACADCGTFL